LTITISRTKFVKFIAKFNKFVQQSCVFKVFLLKFLQIGIPFTTGYAHEKAPNHPYENAFHDPREKEKVEKVATMSLKRGSHSWPSLQKLRHNVQHPKRKMAHHLKRMSLFSKQDPGYESYDSEPSGYDSDPSSEGYDDPSDPSDPSNPYEDPSDPSGYDDPSDPSNPYEDPSEPSGYDDPSEPSGYDDPSDPSNPYEDPSDPSNPYDSDPSEPSGYEDPSEPSNPYEDPSEPSGYEDPSESSGYEGGNVNFAENTDAGKARLAATHTMGSIDETGEVHQHFSRNHLLGDDDDTEPGEAAMDTDGMMGDETDDDLPDGVAQKFIKKTIQVQPGVYMSVEPYYVKPQEMSNELFDSNLELVSMPADVVMNLFIYQKGALNNGQMWLKKKSFRMRKKEFRADFSKLCFLQSQKFNSKNVLGTTGLCLSVARPTPTTITNVTPSVPATFQTGCVNGLTSEISRTDSTLRERSVTSRTLTTRSVFNAWNAATIVLGSLLSTATCTLAPP